MAKNRWLVAAGGALFMSAQASSWLNVTPAEQAARADVIVDGKVIQLDVVVLEDGEPVTLVRLAVNDLLRGSVSSGKLTLGLPGAYVDGRWVGVVGIPEVAVGDELVVFGDAVNDSDVQMLAALPSVFRMQSTEKGDIVADFEGNPVIDLGCTVFPLIARPSDQAPTQEQVVEGLGIEMLQLAPTDRVFVDDPSSLGLAWSEFLTQLATCIEDQPAAEGTNVDIGGGW